MATFFTRWMLFVSSYFPLSVLIAILFYSKQPIMAGCFLAICFIGFLYLLVFFQYNRIYIYPEPYQIQSRSAHGGEVMGYVASYLVPFVTFSLDGWQQVASLLVFIFILGVVYVNSEDMLRINPTLNLLGYHLYEVTVKKSDLAANDDADPDPYALITRRPIKSGQTIDMTPIGPGVYLESGPGSHRV